jgi:hypothetical protein
MAKQSFERQHRGRLRKNLVERWPLNFVMILVAPALWLRGNGKQLQVEFFVVLAPAFAIALTLACRSDPTKRSKLSTATRTA